MPGGKFRPSRVNELDETTWAYLSGIFDGEGTLGEINGEQVGWRLGVSQLKESGLCQWIHQTVGTGTCTPVTGKAHLAATGRRPMSVWRLHAQEDVRAFLVGVFPYSIVKRDRIEKALAELNERRQHYGY